MPQRAHAADMVCRGAKLQPIVMKMEMNTFFQAGDGIRVIGVTGVQTCALPISSPCDPASPRPAPQPRGTPCHSPTARYLAVPPTTRSTTTLHRLPTALHR